MSLKQSQDVNVCPLYKTLEDLTIYRVLEPASGQTFPTNRLPVYVKAGGNDQRMAIRNADKLLGLYNRMDPAANKPSTTVHQLVQELNKWKKLSIKGMWNNNRTS